MKNKWILILSLFMIFLLGCVPYKNSIAEQKQNEEQPKVIEKKIANNGITIILICEDSVVCYEKSWHASGIGLSCVPFDELFGKVYAKYNEMCEVRK